MIHIHRYKPTDWLPYDWGGLDCLRKQWVCRCGKVRQTTMKGLLKL